LRFTTHYNFKLGPLRNQIIEIKWSTISIKALLVVFEMFNLTYLLDKFWIIRIFSLKIRVMKNLSQQSCIRKSWLWWEKNLIYLYFLLEKPDFMLPIYYWFSVGFFGCIGSRLFYICCWFWISKERYSCEARSWCAWFSRWCGLVLHSCNPLSIQLRAT
jgi:hypothetical protein